MIESLVPFNLQQWIKENGDAFQPSGGVKTVFKDSQLMIFVSAGPNTRGDFHVTGSPEFFYQLKGDIVIDYIEDGKRLRSHVREGEVALMPAMVPHSPQRPAGTLGLVVERIRRPDDPDGFQWYCDNCDAKLYEAVKWDGKILRDSQELTREFESHRDRRTCKQCGNVQSLATGPRV